MQKNAISKNPYKTLCFWMNFDFRKQNAFKNICIYRLFENREISHVKKRYKTGWFVDFSILICWEIEGGAVQHNNNNNNNNDGVLVARGGLKSSIPAIKLDTLRGGRKAEPQHKCCGDKQILGMEGAF